ncbi:hypothetical protein HW555_003132, partial [Spodoptera exigua]
AWYDEPYNKKGFDECIEKFHVQPREKGSFQKPDISSVDPCFWACGFKILGFLDSEGQYDLETTHSHYKKENLSYLGEKQEKVEEIIEQCDAALEKITGTDPKAECDRGFQLAKCYVEDMRKLLFEDSRK